MPGIQRADQYVTVHLSSIGGVEKTLAFSSDTTLGDMQKPLCSAFAKSFPKMQAGLVVGGQRTYDSYPLETAAGRERGRDHLCGIQLFE